MNNKWFNMKAENKNVSIDIFGEIGDYGITAQSFKNELDKYSDYENITININSCGGAVFEGIAIYNMLKNNKAKVTVIVNGLAASIASTIAMAGDEIIMYDNSYLMIHLPYTMAMGTEKEMDKASEVLKNIKNDLVKIYQTKFNKSENELIAMLEAETWISGNDALEMGISNSVIEGLEIAAKFEFDKYNNVPADVKDLYAKKYSEFIKDEVKEDALEQPIKAQESIENIDVDNDAETEVKAENEALEQVVEDVENKVEIENKTTLEMADLKIDFENKLAKKETDLQAKIEIISQLENRVSELQSESAKLQDLNTDLQARLNKIVNPAFTKTEDSISSWKEAMAKCNNDYVKARKTYPQLWEKYTFKK